jgi:peptide/nickel transport system ATP-binding protein
MGATHKRALTLEILPNVIIPMLIYALLVVSRIIVIEGVMYAGQMVERASTRSLFHSFRMPDTQALIRSAPSLPDPPHTRLRAISGPPPDMLRPPIGCRFNPRCDYATDVCRADQPALSAADADGTHLYACWHPVSARGVLP